MDSSSFSESRFVVVLVELDVPSNQVIITSSPLTPISPCLPMDLYMCQCQVERVNNIYQNDSESTHADIHGNEQNTMSIGFMSFELCQEFE